MPGDLDAQYVLARHELLSVLEKFGEHLGALILVGAQAVYVHTPESDLATAPFTTDADLAFNPELLGTEPLLEQVLTQVGLVRSTVSGAVGSWVTSSGVPVDFMVPDKLAGPGSRAARLGPHGDNIARRARGLEAAIIDNQERVLESLDPRDTRQIRLRVAGPAALIVAKLHKLADRQHDLRRHDDKDALDIYRLLQSTQTGALAERLGMTLQASVSADVSKAALALLTELFMRLDSVGSLMAARAVGPLDDPDTVAASCAALTQDLLAALQASDS